MAINDPWYIWVAAIDSRCTFAAAVDLRCTFAVDHLHTYMPPLISNINVRLPSIHGTHFLPPLIFQHRCVTTFDPNTCASMVISNIHVLPPLISKIHVWQPLIPIIHEQPPLISNKRAAKIDPQHICIATLDPGHTFVVTVDIQHIIMCSCCWSQNTFAATVNHQNRCVATADPQNTCAAMAYHWHKCAANVDPQYTCADNWSTIHCAAIGYMYGQGWFQTCAVTVDTKHTCAAIVDHRHTFTTTNNPRHTHVKPPLIPLSVMLNESKYYGFIEWPSECSLVCLLIQ